jgi:hypothetical protein
LKKALDKSWACDIMKIGTIPNIKWAYTNRLCGSTAEGEAPYRESSVLRSRISTVRRAAARLFKIKIKNLKKALDKSQVYGIIKTGMIPNIERRLTQC